MPPVRQIAVQDRDAHSHFSFLQQFLGAEEITARLKKVDKELSIEKGIYLQHCVMPKQSFWLGLRAALQRISNGQTLIGAVSEQMHRPLEVAANLMTLKQGMPSSKLSEYRSRILRRDYLEPTLYELDTAAHFWQLGYELSWPQTPTGKNIRSTEFIAEINGSQLEVECKSQTADSGRNIARPKFYRLADAILGDLPSAQLTGNILITVPGRMPTIRIWQDNVTGAIKSLLIAGNTTTHLPDGTAIQLNLRQAVDQALSLKAFEAELRTLQTSFSHIVFRAVSLDSNNVLNPIIIRVSSQSDDQVLHTIYDDLRDANRQLTRKSAAFICCFVPEIQSFEDLQQNSALVNMTRLFFEKHAADCVYAVAYTSDIHKSRTGRIISKSYPAVFFPNHKYDSKYGASFTLSP